MEEPLSVNEILDVVEMGQSRVSRHIKILADAGLLIGRREGSRVYYGIDPEFRKLGLYETFSDLMVKSEHLERQNPGHWLPESSGSDLRRLSEVLEARKEFSIEHFHKHGKMQDSLQKEMVDPDYYRQQILDLLPEPAGVIVDLGCGNGELSGLLVEKSDTVICVDQSRAMLERTKENTLERAEVRLGSLEHLPMADDEADTAILSMALHHVPEPLFALKEAARILKPTGTLIIADLKHHSEELMRNRFADFWLGFEPGRIERDLKEAGFDRPVFEYGTGKGKLECMFVTVKPAEPGKNSPQSAARLQAVG